MSVRLDESLTSMIADYMETGFLDNIVEMLRQDATLYPVIPILLGDQRSRVRLGAAALVESLRKEREAELVALIPRIGELLEHEMPNVRGDAAYALELLGHGDALPFLERALVGEVDPVRQAIAEAIAEISSYGSRS